jgi:osmoprotectant transport system permease protein
VSPRVAAAWEVLPEYLGSHVLLSAAALALGLLIAGLLAVAARRSRAVRALALAGAGVVQTIPSLALLALVLSLCCSRSPPCSSACWAAASRPWVSCPRCAR